MRIVVLDAETLGKDIDLSPLFACGEVKIYAHTEKEELSARLENADVAVLNKVKLGREVFRPGMKLRLICVAATGYDNIDTAAARAHGVAVTNVPGYSTESVAQLTLAMAAALITHLSEYRGFVASGAYSASGAANRLTPPYHEFSALTWGVVGGGAIGSRVAQIASFLGARVLLCRRKSETRFRQADLHTLCRESDILSLHVPLTPETKGMIGERELLLMKSGAVLINVSRGAVCDEEALSSAVLGGRLGGFGADVYTAEPFPSTHPFARIAGLPNVCLTPHMAWGSVEARARCVRMMAENIHAFTAGEMLNRVE